MIDAIPEQTRLLPVVPGYQIHSVLGVGGFATVYLATQCNLHRRVALKIMHPDYAADPDLCERFVREGQDLALLSEHPHIVTVHDVGCHGKLYYIAMQYLPGPTLKQLLQSEAPYQHPLHIITRVAEALGHAHANGYVHRDVKPANILFNRQGEAVLSDFGIAKACHREDQLTRLGQRVGTENYMSPEQIMMSPELDGRSDLYSLGVLFYQTLTRQLPYRTTARQAVLQQHIESPIPLLPDSEADFQPFINRLMAKDREQRYATADHLLDDIHQFIDSGKTLQTRYRAPATRETHLFQMAFLLTGLLIAGLAISLLMPLVADRMATPTESSQQALAEIDSTLELATLNEMMNRIDSPPGSNAIELYRHVLQIDPDNAEAIAALQRLQSHIME